MEEKPITITTEKHVIDPMVSEAALLYVTNRAEMNRVYKEIPIVEKMLDEMFLESESRPDIAERIALVALGHNPSPTKKGYDGSTQDGRPVEAKVRNSVTREDGTLPKGIATITINDVSESIIQRYDEDNPLFVFPYFIDGHLAASFDVEYSVLRPYYVNCLTNTVKGRCSFKLSPTSWVDSAKVSFVHQNTQVVSKLPKMLFNKAFDAYNMPEPPYGNFTVSPTNWYSNFFANPPGMTYNADTKVWTIQY